MSDVKQILGELVAARNERSAERVARLLADDVRYWDCEHGEIAGPQAVAAAMTAQAAQISLETAAASDEDAVLELQLDQDGRRWRSTEVYRLDGGAVRSVKAYFDPAAMRRREALPEPGR
jgi:ketosteroid isomerase-like protein